MIFVIKAVTWDCEDALRLASFWAAVLGSDVDEDSTADPAFVEASGWGGPNMWFNRVPEPKSAKNRLNFDLRPVGTLEDEVRRLTDLGASVATRFEDHVVMRDPGSNEFCVEPGMQI
jgi:hypothetical protein